MMMSNKITGIALTVTMVVAIILIIKSDNTSRNKKSRLEEK